MLDRRQHHGCRGSRPRRRVRRLRDARQQLALPFPIGPQGYYFVAFSGSCLVAWGFCLFGAARGAGGRAIGTATAIGLSLGAIYRLLVWTLGDFWWMGDTPRVEAIVFLVIALAFLWLRPPRAVVEDS